MCDTKLEFEGCFRMVVESESDYMLSFALRLTPPCSDIVFHEAETARLALMETCKLFELSEEPSILAKMGFSRKTARAAANDAMRERLAYGFMHLNDYIHGLEDVWKSKQGKVSVDNGVRNGIVTYLLIIVASQTLSESLR